jgi:cell division protein FtsQ
MWLVICTGMLTLLIAAMRKQKAELCKGYEIIIKGERPDNFFLDQQGISRVLKTSAKGSIRGQVKTAFNLQQMEQALENNVWIKDAQLYFDNKAVLHISVEEREPVARVFTVGGRSFYLDKDEKMMPLSDKAIAKVPVFTGFPDKKRLTKDDSIMVHDINTTAQYILGNSFWTSQVAQVDIVNDCGAGCWGFEMIPIVGRHVVKLGTGEDIDKKFQRLYVFYQQVLSRMGLDHYKAIDVRFAGQVIGAKSDNPKVDSVQTTKRIAELLRHAEEMNKETETTGETAGNQVNVPVADNSQDDKQTADRKGPKAIMPKRQG